MSKPQNSEIVHLQKWKRNYMHVGYTSESVERIVEAMLLQKYCKNRYFVGTFHKATGLAYSLVMCLGYVGKILYTSNTLDNKATESER